MKHKKHALKEMTIDALDNPKERAKEYSDV